MTDLLPVAVEPDDWAQTLDPTAIARFAKNRSWIALALAGRKEQERMQDKLIKGMFRTNADPVDQREVDYTRGVIRGIDLFLGLPDKMQRRLDA